MKKLAKIFLTGMYLHLVLSIAVPVGMLYFGSDGWNVTVIGLFAFYLAMAALVHIAGWGCVVAAVTAYRRNEADKLRQSWKWLKLWSIPFYVLNFLYSFFVWFVLVGASRGIMIFLVPYPGDLYLSLNCPKRLCGNLLYHASAQRMPETAIWCSLCITASFRD